jgi:hypothetical protein
MPSSNWNTLFHSCLLLFSVMHTMKLWRYANLYLKTSYASTQRRSVTHCIVNEFFNKTNSHTESLHSTLTSRVMTFSLSFGITYYKSNTGKTTTRNTSSRNVKICIAYLLNNSCKVTYDQHRKQRRSISQPCWSQYNTHSHAITPGIVARSACGVDHHPRLRMNETWRNNVDTTDHSTCLPTQILK